MTTLPNNGFQDDPLPQAIHPLPTTHTTNAIDILTIYLRDAPTSHGARLNIEIDKVEVRTRSRAWAVELGDDVSVGPLRCAREVVESNVRVGEGGCLYSQAFISVQRTRWRDKVRNGERREKKREWLTYIAIMIRIAIIDCQNVAQTAIDIGRKIHILHQDITNRDISDRSSTASASVGRGTEGDADPGFEVDGRTGTLAKTNTGVGRTLHIHV